MIPYAGCADNSWVDAVSGGCLPVAVAVSGGPHKIAREEVVLMKVRVKGRGLTVWQAFLLAAVAGDRKDTRLRYDRWGWLLEGLSPRDVKGLQEAFPGRVKVLS
ncbi:MAG: hypothetical protein ACPL5F_09670 [Moorellaceae bacterium]